MELINYSKCPACGAAEIYPKLSAKDYTVSMEQFAIWECKACSLRFTQDAPTGTFIGNYYQSENYISHTDTRKGLVNSLYHIVRKRTLLQKKKMIERAVSSSHRRLLDIGAGTGAFSAYMRDGGWEVKGLEPDQAARQRASDLYRLTLYDNHELFNLPHASFDAVTMWHVLEHVHALDGYLSQVRDILSPGGKAFIAVPNYTSYDASVYNEFWAGYDVPRHLYHFSPRSMKLLMAKHQLHLRDIKPMWYDSFYVSMLSEQYKNGSPGYLKALWNGLVSNCITITKKERCSSLIYIIESQP